MTYRPPPCDHCGGRKGKAVKSYQLEPRSWQPRYRLLCSVCRPKLGYTQVSYERPYAGMRAQRLM